MHQGAQRIRVGLGVDGSAGEVLGLHHLRMRRLLLAHQAIPVRMWQARDFRHYQAGAVSVATIQSRYEGAFLLQKESE